MGQETDDSLKDTLNIKDELKALNGSDTTVSSEEEKFKKRLDDIEKMKAQVALRRKSGDEDYVKAALREVVEIGLHSSRILQAEIEAHPDARAVECIATTLNAVSAAAKELHEVEVKNEKIGIAKEQNEIKKLSISNGNPQKISQTNNIICSPSDLLDMMEKAKKDKVKIIDVNVKK